MEPGETSGLPMVCGRSIQGDPRYFPNAHYQGRAIFFCTEFCRSAFEASPDRFVEVHGHKREQGQDDCPLGLGNAGNPLP